MWNRQVDKIIDFGFFKGREFPKLCIVRMVMHFLKINAPRQNVKRQAAIGKCADVSAREQERNTITKQHFGMMIAPNRHNEDIIKPPLGNEHGPFR